MEATAAHPASLVISLPLEYTAFCLRHQELYHRYSRVRLRHEAASRDAVAAALGDLALNWDGALRSACLPAVAWRLLRARVQAAARASDPRPPDTLHRAWPPDQADALILRYRLSLTTDQSAQLMGVDPAVIATHLRTALRDLPR
ncbi:sigma-70 region 4 domain-containing protein [Streptomyces buecherae]|uniref:sigma-70 region 4 domain-containing protein n=1 Tax=Streptomyces buecherae TaxID=2763006 RepID=UPI00164E3D05|nr:sigma-70 region 4 domain-containing protein [Streptomyces buecherae]QNJ43375.1 sigma-70 region 4 domain-containing protein [Streptomyces buecherae]